VKPPARILLADDDEDFVLVAVRALRRSGLRAEVAVARDGADALRQLGLTDDPDGGAPPPGLAVILLDLNMPVLGGYEVLRRVRAATRTRRIPVVVVSTSDRPSDVRRSYELGANSFVVKRYGANGPGRFLADAARYWVELNQPPPAAVERE